MFAQVAKQDSGAEVGAAAVRALEAVEQTRRARKPWYANGQFTWGYDDNVTLRPLDSELLKFQSDEDDAFQSLFLEAGYRFINRQDLRMGLSFAFNHQGYQDLAQNNTMSYNPTAFLEYHKRKKYSFRFSYDYAYYYSGGQVRDMQDAEWYLLFDADEDKLQTHRLSTSLTLLEPYGLSSVINFSWMQKDYCDITPDGYAYQPGFTQNWGPAQSSGGVAGWLPAVLGGFRKRDLFLLQPHGPLRDFRQPALGSFRGLSIFLRNDPF